MTPRTFCYKCPQLITFCLTIKKRKENENRYFLAVGCSAQQVGWPVANRQTSKRQETGKTKWLADHVFQSKSNGNRNKVQLKYFSQQK